MGDRALVVFAGRELEGPCIVQYLHWNGREVPTWLEETRKIMEGRHEDEAYSRARFAGVCHSHVDGNLSVGLWVDTFEELSSHGDAGIIIVQVTPFDWRITLKGGYLTAKHFPTLKVVDDSEADIE